MMKEPQNGVDFEMQELIFQYEQRKRLIDLNAGFTENPYAERIEMLKRKRERGTIDKFDNRKGLEVIKDRQNLNNEKNYLNGKI